MQGTRVQFLVWEDSTSRAATESTHHNCWVHTATTEAPVPQSPCSPTREAPTRRNQRKPSQSNKDPAQPKIINKIFFLNVQAHHHQKTHKVVLCLPLCTESAWRRDSQMQVGTDGLSVTQTLQAGFHWWHDFMGDFWLWIMQSTIFSQVTFTILFTTFLEKVTAY